MRRLLLVGALVACGSKSDAPAPSSPPPPPPPAAPAASAPAPMRSELIDEGARLAKTPDELVAVARTYVDLKNSIGAHAALARAEIDPKDFEIQMSKLDLLQLLGEDQTAAMHAAVANRKPEEWRLVEAYIAVESKQAIDIVADALMASKELAINIDFTALLGVVPGKPKWDVLLAKSQLDEEHATDMGQVARRANAKDVAHQIITKWADFKPTMRIVGELLIEHDRDAAHAAWKKVAEPTSTGMAGAIAWLARALVETDFGDQELSEAAEKQAAALAGPVLATASPADHDAYFMGRALLLQARGDSVRSRALAYANLSPAATAKLCFLIADHGWRDAAIELADGVKPRSDDGFEQVFYLDVMHGDLALARAVAKSRKLDTSLILDAYADAGDTAAVADIAGSDDESRKVGVQRLARMFAKKGDCTRAKEMAANAPAAKTYATVARYCSAR